MGHLVIAVVVAAGTCFVGTLGASGRSGERSGDFAGRRTDEQRYQGLGWLGPRLASVPLGALRPLMPV